MAVLDIIILVPLVWGAYKGFKKGLFIELATILGFIIATIAAFALLDWGIKELKEYISNESILPALSFIIIFILVLVGITLGAKALKAAMDWTLLGTADDTAGAIAGILKWVFIMSVFFWFLEEGELSLPDSFTEGTVIYPYLILVGPWIIDAIGALTPLTEDLMEGIKEYI